ncbi:dynein beta chain, ciliary-like, partial [Drosophila serrata]|uniref:dynein beta chain, ciliary-like n=1 Tax=Drosophila serrata TaxID=7274 RepID=UPI000A1D3844
DLILEFLNNPNKKRIIFSINAGGQLYPSFNFPVKPRTKVAYFIRSSIPLNLTEENMLDALMIGDLLPNPLANLSVLCDEVFFPLLNNKVNQTGWTSVIANDMKTESQEMRNGIAQMKGLVINRTIFPLPICMDEVMQVAPAIATGDISVVNPLMKHSLEFMVVKWLDSVEDLVNIKAREKIYSKENYPLPEEILYFGSHGLRILRVWLISLEIGE